MVKCSAVNLHPPLGSSRELHRASEGRHSTADSTEPRGERDDGATGTLRDVVGLSVEPSRRLPHVASGDVC